MLLAVMALPACVLAGQPVAQPAVIVAPDDASRADLAAALERLVGRSAAVDALALTTQSTLALQRSTLRDPLGHPMQGREQGRPFIVQLVLLAGHCELVNPQTGQRTRLPRTRCRALP